MEAEGSSIVWYFISSYTFVHAKWGARTNIAVTRRINRYQYHRNRCLIERARIEVMREWRQERKALEGIPLERVGNTGGIMVISVDVIVEVQCCGEMTTSLKKALADGWCSAWNCKVEIHNNTIFLGSDCDGKTIWSISQTTFEI